MIVKNVSNTKHLFHVKKLAHNDASEPSAKLTMPPKTARKWKGASVIGIVPSSRHNHQSRMQENNVRLRGTTVGSDPAGFGDVNKNIERKGSPGKVIIEAPSWPSGLKDNDFGKAMLPRLFHWGPLTAFSIVLIISSATIYIHLQWWPLEDIKAFLHFSLYLFFNYATLNNLCLAGYIGPGYVPRHWTPPTKEDEENLQYCLVCEGYKVPRSHHCSRCGRCAMKMDHHCLPGSRVGVGAYDGPFKTAWINNCVGHRNHAFFIRFLAAAVGGCAHATYICGSGLYYAVFRVWYFRYGTGYEPVVILGLHSFLAIFFAFGLALGAVIAIGFLLCVQIRIVLRNRTGVEDYIIGKANSHSQSVPFVYPYDLGWQRNVSEVLGTWSGRTKGNGVWWPVIAATDQFTFSVSYFCNLLALPKPLSSNRATSCFHKEQIYQKWLKLEHAREYVIVRSHPGGFLQSIKLGLRIFFCQPCSDETRVSVQQSQHWLVTRGNKYWLYGRLMVGKELKTAAELRNVPRGWFPRVCAERFRSS
ncbi:unnamed protein product [Enterobius vermicularis]|uniref:Palmitoyltransferase n=1 Tax=Enterobius vermicularis TaxID=51028 RepID=A0A0N4VCD3_ENTVE|nr:unnamed protein product [Enterobius vermicularis]